MGPSTHATRKIDNSKSARRKLNKVKRARRRSFSFPFRFAPLRSASLLTFLTFAFAFVLLAEVFCQSSGHEAHGYELKRQQLSIQQYSTSTINNTITTTSSTNRLFAENLVVLGILQPVPCIKPIPTHEKIFAVGKSGPKRHF